MSARQVRVETRSRHQSDLKRVMHSTAKVRRWEKKWVQVGDSPMQIFKWMPITKADDQQEQPKSLSQQVDLTQRDSKREVLTSDSSQINSNLERCNNSKSIGQLGTLIDDHVDMNMTMSMDTNGSQVDVVPTNNISGANSNNTYTSMHHEDDAERGNKRKLNDLDLITSSDSCASSSCSSLNDSMLESERTQKRPRTDEDSNQSNFGSITHTDTQLTNTEPMNGHQTGLLPNVNGDAMMVVAASRLHPSSIVVNQNGQNVVNEEVCMDSEEDLTDAARLVTEQIVTKVADCYMNI